jgi:hypothetical protein
MARTKQALRGRAKTHQQRVLRLRKRKNRLKGKRRSARNRPHRRQGATRK